LQLIDYSERPNITPYSIRWGKLNMMVEEHIYDHLLYRYASLYGISPSRLNQTLSKLVVNAIDYLNRHDNVYPFNALQG
jgi:hypothetical protein